VCVCVCVCMCTSNMSTQEIDGQRVNMRGDGSRKKMELTQFRINTIRHTERQLKKRKFKT
jgi:hypothetical protein